ncbi:MAG: methyltransferase domain-containing protein [Spirochaetales bacterium]|nr:MAG: methyltransferase domain-containing protein [Spirochaetales bacterium]
MQPDPFLPQGRLDSLLAAWRDFAMPGRREDGTGTWRAHRDTAVLSHAELDELGRTVLRLQRGLTGERELVGASYMDDPALLGVYLLYYWPVSYAQAARALALSGLKPRRVLDMGSGPGPMAAAALDAGATDIVALDRSAPALDLASRLLGSSLTGTMVADLENEAAAPQGPFDLVIFGHSLNELGAERPDRLARRFAVVSRVASSLAPGGAILIIDPATITASRDTLALRDALLSAGWNVLAPCTMQHPCPALSAGPAQSCHDQSSWTVPPVVQALAARAGLDREFLKMTWLAIEPPETGPATSVRSAGQATGIHGAYRVVSDPMLNKGGRVRYLLCGSEGRFPLSARRGDPIAEQNGFFSLCRYDMIRVLTPEIRENGWGMDTGTRLRNVTQELVPKSDLD